MKLVTRRQLLALLGGALFIHRRADACVVTPSLTQGPFWVDEKLERSDLASDASGPIQGVPLTLHIDVTALGKTTCDPLAGAQVDVWHCDARGIYSDADNMGEADTRGKKYLRGFQMTDARGRVTFKTIVPGWYHGRTVHIHVKVRRFDTDRALLTEATTQLFFDDKLTTALFAAHAAYHQKDERDTFNKDDGIYGDAGKAHKTLLLSLKGDARRGFEGHALLAIEDGVITEEQMPDGPPPGGPPPWGQGPPPPGMRRPPPPPRRQ